MSLSARILIGLVLGMVAAMPLAFPRLESASFYSTTLVEPVSPVDFVPATSSP